MEGPTAMTAAVRAAAVAAARAALVRRVTRVLLGLGAHLHGEVVAVAVVLGEPERVELIEYTLAQSVAHVVPRLLATEFRVEACDRGSGGGRTSHMGMGTRCGSVYRVSPASCPPMPTDACGCLRTGAGAGTGIGVDIAPLPMPSALRPPIPQAYPRPPAFDFEALALSSSRMYISKAPASAPSPAPAEPSFQTDQLVSALARLRDRRFRLSGAQLDVSAHGAAMCRAARLVLDDGWHMDAPQGGDSWVVARWSVLQVRPASVRTRVGLAGLAGHAGPQLSQGHGHGPGRASGGELAPPDSLCPICQEAFFDSDIVVNLPCGHNMHAVCNRCGPSPSGLCAWLAAGQGTCPCCRASVAPIASASAADVD